MAYLTWHNVTWLIHVVVSGTSSFLGPNIFSGKQRPHLLDLSFCPRCSHILANGNKYCENLGHKPVCKEWWKIPLKDFPWSPPLWAPAQGAGSPLRDAKHPALVASHSQWCGVKARLRGLLTTCSCHTVSASHRYPAWNRVHYTPAKWVNVLGGTFNPAVLKFCMLLEIAIPPLSQSKNIINQQS